MSSSLEYYPLIGVDWSNNEHFKEWNGRNWEDAAEALGKRYGYAKVLSNHAGQKRGANGKGMWNRKLLFTAPEPPYQDMKRSADAGGLTLSDFLAQKSTGVLALSLVKDPRALVEILREHGFTFELKEVAGKWKLFMDRRVTCSASEKELGHVRDLVREHRKEIIQVLEEETAAANSQGEVFKLDTPAAVPADPLKGKKLRDITASMLPQMPRPFTIDDLTSRLRAAGYTELADDRPCVTNQIYGAISRNQVSKVGYAKYEFIARRAAVPDPPPSEEVATIAPVQRPSLDSLGLEALQPPRGVIEVAAPSDEPEPEPTPEPAEAHAQPTPTPTPDPEPSPRAAASQVTQSSLATMLEFAAQAAAGTDDTATLAALIQEAKMKFESTMLDAVEVFSAAIKPVEDQLNKRSEMRRALLQLLVTTQEEANR
jgi:hypothetical protein